MSTHQVKELPLQPAMEMHNIAELLAHALALEEEASERYAELAEVMQAHNNPDAAELFTRMAGVEQMHVDGIRQQIRQRKLTDLPSAQYRWLGLEGPETTDHADLHYLMTPRQALLLALLNEQRARDFYNDICRHSSDPEVVELARELAAEEREHVAWVEQWLERFPPTEDGWDHDDDPPNLQA
jgi:rubrerythrin